VCQALDSGVSLLGNVKRVLMLKQQLFLLLQICLWCWHQIMEMAEGEGKCPACRTPYDKNKVAEASQALPEE
jgi:rubrerythrin